MVFSQCVTSALFLGNMLRAWKYRFASCFRVLSNQYVERSAYANVFKFNRENERFERGKLSSRCFYWFPAAMLESLRRAPTWHLHTKHYNFKWYLLPNNSRSSSEYRTSAKPRHVVHLLLLYDISISWLNLLNGKRFYFFTCVIIKVAGNSFQYFQRLTVWWIIITTIYQLMPTSWYQQTAQSSVNKLLSILWHNRLP